MSRPCNATTFNPRPQYWRPKGALAMPMGKLRPWQDRIFWSRDNMPSKAAALFNVPYMVAIRWSSNDFMQTTSSLNNKHPEIQLQSYNNINGLNKNKLQEYRFGCSWKRDAWNILLCSLAKQRTCNIDVSSHSCDVWIDLQYFISCILCTLCPLEVQRLYVDRLK